VLVVHHAVKAFGVFAYLKYNKLAVYMLTRSMVWPCFCESVFATIRC